jgi:hypothetical protein
MDAERKGAGLGESVMIYTPPFALSEKPSPILTKTKKVELLANTNLETRRCRARNEDLRCFLDAQHKELGTKHLHRNQNGSLVSFDTPKGDGEKHEVAPWLDVRANDSLLLQTATADTVEALAEAAKTAGVAVTSDYEEEYPEYGHQGGRGVAIDKALAQYLADERQALIADIGSEDALGLLTSSGISYAPGMSNAELRALKAEIAERHRLRDEITNGQSTFSMRSANGNRIVYDSETGHELQFSQHGSDGRPRKSNEENWFETTDIQTLRKVHAQIMEERRLQNTDRSELRKEVAEQHRPKFSAPLPDTTPVEKLTSDGYVLVNPATLAEFTKPQLLAFLDVKGNAAKILVGRDSKIVNTRAVVRMKEILGSN